MKKILILTGILMLALAAQAFGSQATDAPHNITWDKFDTTACNDCHDYFSTYTDSVCTRCHTNQTGAGYTRDNAKYVQTHSKATTGSTRPEWSVTCVECHFSNGLTSTHGQLQTYIYGSPTYLVTGTLTLVQDDTVNDRTIFGYTITTTKPGWDDFTKWAKKNGGNERGLILYPSTLSTRKRVNFEVIDATATQITVRGSKSRVFGTTADSITFPSTFALTYGQFMNTLVRGNTVRLYSNTGQNSFAVDDSGGTGTDTVRDGICQVCHTVTQHWRSDGTLANHNSGTNCIQCHKHEEGFKAGGCDTCHGNPPVDNSLGGPTGLVNNPEVTGATTSGAHSKHATGVSGGYGYACEKCHTGGMPASAIPDKIIEIGFNIAAYQTGTYDGRTLPLLNGYTYLAGNAGTTITNNGAQSCTNIYCHSNAKGGTAVEEFASPAWTGAPQTCTSCHGYPPQYENGGAGTATANSHVPHVTNNDFGCELCHNTTTTNGTTITGTAMHVNGAINVAFDATNPGGSYAPATKTCSTTVCHGAGAPQWGGTVICQDCHLGTADLDDFSGTFYDNGTTATIKNVGEWDTSGHGKASGSYTSGNPAAGFTVADACLYCHDETVAHKTATNPFRLKNFADASWGKNGNCQSCHATNSAGITVNNVLKNGTKKIGSTHYGSKHSAANSGGQFCWDCHDPHGDNNIFMVHASVGKTSDATTGAPTASVATTFTAFATGTDYAKSTPPFTGICNVCHTNTNHYTSTTGDGHNSGIRCTDCHQHSVDTKTDAFRPSGCDTCHGNPPITNTTTPTPPNVPNTGLVNNPEVTGATTAGVHALHATTAAGSYGYSCEKCHAGGMPASPVPNMKIEMGFNISAAYQTGIYDGRTLPLPNGYSYIAGNAGTTITNTGGQSCNNIYCHSNAKVGTSAQTFANPAWTNGPLTCLACHGFPPSYVNGGAGAATANSHVIHVSNNNFGCQVCHNKTVFNGGSKLDVTFHANASIDVNFDATNPSGAYNSATKTCSSTTCHGTGTPQWGASLSADCTACHGGNAASSAPIALQNHPDHMNNAGVLGTNYECAQCHNTTVSPGNDRVITGTAHANGTKDVAFQLGGTWTAGSMSCSSVYCHSSGKGTYVNPHAWGSATDLGCNSCHGTSTASGAPDYANAGAGQPNANSHAKHVGAGSSSCDTCHTGTVAASGTVIEIGSMLHTNHTLDVTFNTAIAGAGAAWTAATKTCSNVACHGTGAPQWGATSIACQSCHLGAADIDDFAGTFYNNGAASAIKDAGEWDTAGHGKAAGSYASGNAAAGFTTSNACLFCHDDTIAHNTASNPFRLRNIGDATWGKNGACQNCHEEGSAGITVDGVNKNGTKKIGSTHYGAKHTTTLNGGQFCWDCHDPHGDTNVYMIHKSVAKTSDPSTGAPTATVDPIFTAFATGTDYAKSSAPFTGICNVCHTITNHYTSASGDGHNSTTRCTNCHKHTGETTTDAFAGFGDCIGCHSSSQGNRAPVVGQLSSNSHHIQGVTLTNAHCYQCHWEADSNGSMTAYHGGASASGSPVNLVIYGAGTRPTIYTAGTTAVEYTAGATGGSAGGMVKVVDTWRKLTTSGSGSSRTASFTAGAGTVGNRMVIIGIGWEHSTSSGCNPSAITGNYGGQTITTINEANASNNREGQWMGYIGESGIASRSNNTITLTFSGCTPNLTPTISVATYEGVDQSSAPASAIASGTTGSSFSWSGLPVFTGGYAMYNLNADGISSFTPPSGYTERYDTSATNFRMTGGDKAITADGTESRTVTGNTSSSRWALVAVSVKPTGGREIQKINLHCLGCHSAQNNTTMPFGDGKTPKQYAWDNTSVAERYTQAGTTNWGKYSGNYTAAKVAVKAYSAHGNAAANQRGWDARAATAGGTGVDGTLPNTSGNVQVACFDCHNSHGSSVAGTTTSYDTQVTGATNGGILKDTTTGLGGYETTYKPQLGGSVPTKNAYNPGAAICFDCHLTQTGGTTTPWGYSSTYNATQAIMSYFEKPYWIGAAGVNPTGAQKRYPYKNLLGSVGSHFGASSPLTTQVMGTINGLCTPCHDPHGVSPALGANQGYGVPLLKGTWMTSPYREDAAPSGYVSVSGEGRRGSGGTDRASSPGYKIDQNTFGSNWSTGSSGKITQTDAQFAGLCLKCHAKTAINPTTGGTWKSMDRIHNTVKGWGGSGGNANNAVHAFTCSKCHTPHNACLPKLGISNCLDFTHRGRVGDGGAPNRASGSGERGGGGGQFPAGGGSDADHSEEVGFGDRSCHDKTNSSGWPNNQRWNAVTPWGTPGKPTNIGGRDDGGGRDGGGGWGGWGGGY